MPIASRLRATLRGRWWRAQLEAVRHCFYCGGWLKKAYVPIEKRRRLVCAKCRQITYINPRVVAGLIPVLPNGDIVLLRREFEPAKGKWSYPAGFQELGETVADAAVRETWEEIRTRVKITQPLGVYSYADAGVVTIVYVGRVLRGENPSPGEESQEVQAFHRDNIPWKELAFRSTIQALKEWRTQRSPKRTRRK